MRKVAILLMAALMPLAGLTAGASARPASPHLPGLTPIASDALSDALDEGRISESEYALHRARSLFRLGAVRREFGAVVRPDPHAATWILRDLALRTSSLSGGEKDTAEAILARPDDSSGGGFPGTGWSNTATPGPKKCGENVCVHWVTNTTDKSTEAWATSTLATFEEVWTKEVDVMGFNAPKSDGTEGGDSKLDVYIDNFDADGLYGYCNTGPFSAPPWDQPVYCSVDNDYANFVVDSPLSALQILQATSAHEFFHAVQYSYDAGDDAWVGEATATWIEDEVYDAVNDNRGYVDNSISMPKISADSWGGENGAPPGFQYGQWIWFRYLTETHGPDLVKKLWERLDARTGAPDDYSVEGLTSVLSDPAYNTNFGASFASFAATNVKPSAFYSEAAEDPKFYAPAPRDATYELGAAATGTVSNVRHLSSRYITFKPATGTAATDQLTVRVNMSDTLNGSRATLVSLPQTGTAPVFTVFDELDSTGAGSETVSFGDMSEVVLVLTNASNRYSGCHKNELTTSTCNGRPVDDGQGYGYSAAIGTTAPEPPPSGSAPTDTVAPGLSGVRVRPNPVSAGKTANILFTIDEAALVNIVVSRSGRPVVSGTIPINSPNSYRVPWKTTKKTAAGKYTVKITATDNAGNARKARTTVKVTK